MLRCDVVCLLLVVQQPLNVCAESEEEVPVLFCGGLGEVGRLGEEGVEGGEEVDGVDFASVDG